MDGYAVGTWSRFVRGGCCWCRHHRLQLKVGNGTLGPNFWGWHAGWRVGGDESRWRGRLCRRCRLSWLVVGSIAGSGIRLARRVRGG